MKIYTKKGDAGTTSLLGGTRVSKYNLRIEAYGTVDELNAHLGLIGDQDIAIEHRGLLKTIQDRLFTLGSILACDPEKNKVKLPQLEEGDISILEKSMDNLSANLPALKNFVLPGGHPANSMAHIARCVCRRAERRVVELNEEAPMDPLILQYLNRLSDWLFILSRSFSAEAGAAENLWNA